MVSDDTSWEIFDRLKRLGAFQFSSYISAAQYLLPYRITLDNSPPRCHVLDWGAGEGHFSYFLLHQGYSVTGFEPDSSCRLADTLRKEFPERYTLACGSASPSLLPFPDASFDVVVSVGVLEHVRETGGNELASLNEIARVLKGDGIFLCYHFPNRFSWIEAIARRIPGIHSHIYRYTGRDIRKLIAASGMDLVASGRYGLLPRLPFRAWPAGRSSTEMFNCADRFLERVLPWFCQNYFFVSRKKGLAAVQSSPHRPSALRT